MARPPANPPTIRRRRRSRLACSLARKATLSSMKPRSAGLSSLPRSASHVSAVISGAPRSRPPWSRS
ncbi:MAG: hypothetical protein KDI07_05700, partial [Anaerolineae bacterium]|nr:hypothetical protein [Anaerolineae bacterium]